MHNPRDVGNKVIMVVYFTITTIKASKLLRRLYPCKYLACEEHLENWYLEPSKQY